MVGESDEARAEGAYQVAAGWKAMSQQRDVALAMIREAVEAFGPIASLESREATLALRGPEPIHEAEAIVEALLRVRGQVPHPVCDLRRADPGIYPQRT